MTAVPHLDRDLAAGNPNLRLDAGVAVNVAAAPPLLTSSEHLRLRGAVGDAIVTLGRLVGVGVVEQLRRDYDEVASQAWTLDRIAAAQAERVGLLERLLEDALTDRERARGIACSLEGELAAWRNSTWLTRYCSRLEGRVGPDVVDEIVAEVNALPPAPADAPAPELETTGMLPVVDDATLPEHALAFRAGETLVAVGRVDRLFAPLDTATEIALGATPFDVEGEAARPLDDLEVREGRFTWPDGTEWFASADREGAWLLMSTPQHGGQWADVAGPALRVNVGELWMPYGDGEFPLPTPPGPANPPRPAGHNPVA